MRRIKPNRKASLSTIHRMACRSVKEIFKKQKYVHAQISVHLRTKNGERIAMLTPYRKDSANEDIEVAFRIKMNMMIASHRFMETLEAVTLFGQSWSAREKPGYPIDVVDLANRPDKEEVIVCQSYDGLGNKMMSFWPVYSKNGEYAIGHERKVGSDCMSWVDRSFGREFRGSVDGGWKLDAKEINESTRPQ